MVDDVLLFAIGAAAVLDLVLLLGFLDPPNWRQIAVWMLALTVGVWMWHAGTFFHLLLHESTGPLALRAQTATMTAMAAGLLLMPSAMLHGLYRLSRLELGVSPRANRLLLLLYVPLALLLPICLRIAEAPERPFQELLSGYIGGYLVWMSGVNLVAAAGLLRVRSRILQPRTCQFFGWTAVALVGMTAVNLFIMLVALPVWPQATKWLQLVLILSPVLPTLLFAFFVLRYQFMPLVLERTLVYGAVVIGALLLHRLATRDVADAVQQKYGVDFGILEGVAAIALILVYQPLRRRVTEALRYLFASPSAGRDLNRRLSVELASRAGGSVEELLAWFADSIRSALRVKSAGAWLFDPDAGVICRVGDTPQIADDDAAYLHQALSETGLPICTQYDAPHRKVLDLLQRAKASAIIRIDQGQVAGLLMVGSKRLNQALGDEELNSLVLLSEQLGATLQNCLLHAARATAERRATQQEKLSTLGLLAGSIAHELKNPLSSMKAIATVLAEDLGKTSPHAEDLRLILGEIDRLVATTSQLLDIARPASNVCGDGCRVQDALDRTLRLVGHFARQQHVEIELQIGDELPAVAADDIRLREIFLNLLSNSIEASGNGGKISVTCRNEEGHVVTEIRDNGPGLAAEVRQRLFEPFVTTKETGTGLGLYLVGCRIRELGGEVSCEAADGRGTAFVVRIPLKRPPAER